MCEAVDPCDPDPCPVIQDAIADTCTAVGQTDFTCDCDAGFVWEDPSNTCTEDPTIARGRDDYDVRCAFCHSAGSHDTVEEVPGSGDVAGTGSLLVPDLGTLSPLMTGITLTQQEMDDLAAFLDSL